MGREYRSILQNCRGLGTRRVFVGAMFMSALAAASAALLRAAAAADSPPQTIRMVIDYGDGAEVHLTALPYRAEMTVLDALEAAGAHPHGVKFKWRGSGETAFVTQVGDVKNEGGGQGRNWTYFVDGHEPNVGVGTLRLKPGSVVLWKFGTSDYNR
jgi:hypothetical protein